MALACSRSIGRSTGAIPWTAPECTRAATVHLGGLADEVITADSAREAWVRLAPIPHRWQRVLGSSHLATRRFTRMAWSSATVRIPWSTFLQPALALGVGRAGLA
jgi:hypothetical protein